MLAVLPRIAENGNIYVVSKHSRLYLNVTCTVYLSHAYSRMY